MTRSKKIIISLISLGIVLILTALFLLIPWKSNRDVESLAPPREVIPGPLPAPILSTLTAKVELPLPKVREYVADIIGNYVREPIQWEDDRARATIYLKPGAPTIMSTRDGRVSVKIPLQISGELRADTGFLSFAVKGPITGQALLSLTLTPTLSPEWRFTLETDVNILVQEAEAVLERRWFFEGQTLSLRATFAQVAKETVLPQLQETIANIDIDLKPRAADVWAKLHKPILLKAEPLIVLTLEPREILAQKLTGDRRTLSLNIGIKTFIQVNGGDVSTDPASPAKPRSDLPDIRFVDALTPGYHINAPVQITYAALEDLARSYIEKAQNPKGIVLENLTLYGSGTQLAADVGFRMPFLGATGQLYLLGTPRTGPTALSFAITEFDHAFTTQSLLLKIVENRGEGIFSNVRTTLEDKLTLRLSTLQEKLLDGSEYHLSVSRGTFTENGLRDALSPGLSVQSTVDTVIVGDSAFTQTALFIPLRLQGNLNCEIRLSSFRSP